MRKMKVWQRGSGKKVKEMVIIHLCEREDKNSSKGGSEGNEGIEKRQR